MPIYEYICSHCNKRFEILQKITEKPQKNCTKCKGKLEKLISQSSFHLKGTGWFKSAEKPKEKIEKKEGSPSKPSEQSASHCDSK